jgi:hypothetical protein
VRFARRRRTAQQDAGQVRLPCLLTQSFWILVVLHATPSEPGSQPHRHRSQWRVVGQHNDATIMAYRQLQAALLKQMRSSDVTLNRASTVSAVMNAWTVVDAAIGCAFLSAGSATCGGAAFAR